MTPEALSTGQVCLYRASRFPDRWDRVAGLVPGRHADPTVFRAGGLWWMFTGTTPEDNADLRLFFADDLFGPWAEHPRSPVVAGDPRRARPAGRVVAWDGALLRFAQDCVPFYGMRVNAFRIDLLTRDDDEEVPARVGPVVGPSGERWNRCGMHHVDAHPLPDVGCVAAVDGR